MELNRMTCKKVVVSHETLGSEHLRLYSVRPYYHYEGKVRTDKIDGYTYSVICPKLENNFLGVKIPGKQLLFDDAYDHLVQFDNLRIGIYFRCYLDIDDVGTDYIANPTSGEWEQLYLLPPHIDSGKENENDEPEQE